VPFVHVHWFEGRTEEQKAEIAKRITEALSEVGGSPPEDIWIRFDDSPKASWTFGGERKQ
jgi:4-oxalocrotonate tautomerase